MNISPYKNTAFNKIYNLLFCDDASLFAQPDGKAIEYPWKQLVAAHPLAEELKKVKQDETIDARARILASNLLLAGGNKAEAKELMGVVVEVGLEDGLDVIAAYKDGTARYINQSEKAIVWESPSAASKILIDNLFAVSETVVAQIGPWNKSRLAQPGKNEVRLSFLVSDGLYFGQGPFDILEKDPLAGMVIMAAAQLMIFLTEQNN